MKSSANNISRRRFLAQCAGLTGLAALAGGCAATVNNYTLPCPQPNARRILRPGTSGYSGSPTPAIQTPIPAYASRDWLPPLRLEEKGRWQGILIHHSATPNGDATAFDNAHRNRGWDSLGYHFVIDNGNNAHGKSNGTVEVGPRWQEQKYGAHCRVDPNDDNYWNDRYIGICLVGDFETTSPTGAQYLSLSRLVAFLKSRYGIPDKNIMGHRDVPGAKTRCPGQNFSWNEFRRRLSSV